MNTRTASNPKRLETDIVIIGGGGAGLAVAFVAGEKGANYLAAE